jgi:hypothetical protein
VQDIRVDGPHKVEMVHFYRCNLSIPEDEIFHMVPSDYAAVEMVHLEDRHLHCSQEMNEDWLIGYLAFQVSAVVIQ